MKEKCNICEHVFGFNEARYGKNADLCENCIFKKAVTSTP